MFRLQRCGLPPLRARRARSGTTPTLAGHGDECRRADAAEPRPAGIRDRPVLLFYGPNVRGLCGSHGAGLRAWSAPGCLAVALIQRQFLWVTVCVRLWLLRATFHPSHVVPNLTRYGTWLWGAADAGDRPALLAPVVLPGALTPVLLALFVDQLHPVSAVPRVRRLVVLRFLLPTIPLILVLVAAVMDGLRCACFGSGIVSW